MPAQVNRNEPPVEIHPDDHFFHPLEAVRRQVAADPRTKEIAGNDDFRLPTPGLVELESIRTRGGTEIPVDEQREYPGDIPTLEGTAHNVIREKHEHVRHVRTLDEDGNEVENFLLRSKLSNGTGKWPAADSFFVTCAEGWKGEGEKSEGEKGEGARGRGEKDAGKGEGEKGEPGDGKGEGKK